MTAAVFIESLLHVLPSVLHTDSLSTLDLFQFFLQVIVYACRNSSFEKL